MAGVCGTVALAQVAEIGAHGGVSLMRNNGIGSLFATSDAAARPDDTTIQDGWRLGFRLTLNNPNFFGHEFGYAYNRANWKIRITGEEAGSAVHQGFYNFLVYSAREGKPVRPFVTGGAGFNTYVFPGYSVSSGGGSTKFGVNAGGGVKFKISPMMLMRFDVRAYTTPKPFDLPGQRGWIRQIETSIGLSLAL
jgi:opacity protein-like surface antigen